MICRRRPRQCQSLWDRRWLFPAPIRVVKKRLGYNIFLSYVEGDVLSIMKSTLIDALQVQRSLQTSDPELGEQAFRLDRNH